VIPLLTSIALGLAFGLAAWAARLLTLGGAILAAGIGTVVLASTGWTGAGALLTFFLSSALLGLFRRRLEGLPTPTPRAAGQVVANGCAATVAATAVWLGWEAGWTAFLGALAAACADTWSTELGMLLGRSPRSIITWRRVEPGANGGVSLPGFAASLAGAGAVGLWVGELRLLICLAAIGFGAALLDSVLGAGAQAEFICEVCGRRTEHPRHHGRPAKYVRGWRWLRNNQVNFLATVAGGVAGWFLPT
jgi:uncharacterized protein (TIGR00297 family)